MLSGSRHNLWIGLLLGGYLLFMVGDGVRQILDYNDFDVFYMAGELASEHSPDLYTQKSPAENRPFLYPPIAAILFLPLSWFPYWLAALLFTTIKATALAGLVWGAVRFSGAAPAESRHWPILLLLTFLIPYRFIGSDHGNGQVNLIVAALAAWGIWWPMSHRGTGLISGAAGWAASVAIKATPLLLIAVPFLHCRVRVLAAQFAWLGLFLLLPLAWWGPALGSALYREFANLSSHQIFEATESDRQISVSEMAIFTLAQFHAPDDLLVDDDELYKIVDGQRVDVDLPKPMTPAQARLLWLAIAAAVGGFYLGGRWWLGRYAAPVDWSWDLAVLAILSLLLSPLVRKAHLVLLIVPVGWLVANLAKAAATAGVYRMGKALGWLWRHRRIPFAALCAATALLWISEDLVLPSFGPMSYHCGLFFALLALLTALAAEALAHRPPGQIEAARQ